jgi:hypothetical protein
MLSSERLKEIQERADKATAGPWTPCTCSLKGPCAGVDGVFVRFCTEGRQVLENHANDTAFAAHARQDIPDLLTELARLRGELEGLRAAGKAVLEEREVLWGALELLSCKRLVCHVGTGWGALSLEPYIADKTKDKVLYDLLIDAGNRAEWRRDYGTVFPRDAQANALRAALDAAGGGA